MLLVPLWALSLWSLFLQDGAWGREVTGHRGSQQEWCPLSADVAVLARQMSTLWTLLWGHLGWSFEEPPITGVSCCGSPGADCANIGCPFTAFPQLLGPRASWVHTLYHPVFWGLLDPDELSSLRKSLLDNLSPISHRRTPASPAPASSRYTDCSHSSPLLPLCVPRHSS